MERLNNEIKSNSRIKSSLPRDATITRAMHSRKTPSGPFVTKLVQSRISHEEYLHMFCHILGDQDAILVRLNPKNRGGKSEEGLRSFIYRYLWELR